jgi:hypothetical protein
MSDDSRRSELDPLASTTDATNGVGPHDDAVADASAGAVAEAVSTAPAGDADRGSTDFIARLADAMRQTAEAERSRVGEDIDRRRTEHLAAIAARRESEATRMRELAADDRKAIESWADAERQRIKKERDERLAGVEADLGASLDEHAKTVDAEVERVESAISAYRAEVDAFFGSLEEESDPERIAQFARQRPAFPDLETVAATRTSRLAGVSADPSADGSGGDPETSADPAGEPEASNDGASAAAEAAEVAATAGAETQDEAASPSDVAVMDPIARLGLLRASDKAAERGQPRPVPAGSWRPSTAEPGRDRSSTSVGSSSSGLNPIGWIRRKDDSAER